ncbi:MAG: hypothetical protein V1871_07555 [Planctomycetota bacterium]
MSIFEISINSEESLLKSFDFLHDASCNQEDVKYDQEKGTLDIIFNRDFLEDPTKITTRRVFLIFHEFEFPIVKSYLHLESLMSCKIFSNDKSLTRDTFTECKKKKNKYILWFNLGLEIELDFKSSINGYLRDVEFVHGKTGSFMHFKSKLKNM